MTYKFSAADGSAIGKTIADKWIENYKQKNPGRGEIVAHFFGRDIIDKILAQEECLGIRIYYGLDEAGNKQLLLMGAKENGANLSSGIIGDASKPCPPYCP